MEKNIKCYKCKKKATGWINTKPVCIVCFEKVKKPRRIIERELTRKRREAMGIILCS